ncbi:MAG: metalloregulator ArsR/SmtB family transcription factor [Hyphomonadaceae bacterium]
METSDAIGVLSALAQEGRLAAFRFLVRAGPEGAPAGDIARALDVAPNTLSAQLSLLANAGLIGSRRDGRSIIYAANYDAIGALIVYLMEDCCGGKPEICAPVLAAARCAPASTRARRGRG